MSVWLWAFVGIARTTREPSKARGSAILAIGAHPEDIERGCGGTLSRYKELGYRVYALVMTSGEKSILHLSADDRRKDAEEGAEILGIDRVWVYHFKEAALATQIREMKDVIGEKIRQTRAEIVITHSSHDAHRDHAAVFEATRSAAGAEKTILCYEVDTLEREFSPNYFVDITGYLEEKVSAIDAHRKKRDQSGSPAETVAGRASRRGQQVGVKHAEAFILYKGMDLWPS